MTRFRRSVPMGLVIGALLCTVLAIKALLPTHVVRDKLSIVMEHEGEISQGSGVWTLQLRPAYFRPGGNGAYHRSRTSGADIAIPFAGGIRYFEKRGERFDVIANCVVTSPYDMLEKADEIVAFSGECLDYPSLYHEHIDQDADYRIVSASIEPLSNNPWEIYRDQLFRREEGRDAIGLQGKVDFCFLCLEP